MSTWSEVRAGDHVYELGLGVVFVFSVRRYPEDKRTVYATIFYTAFGGRSDEEKSFEGPLEHNIERNHRDEVRIVNPFDAEHLQQQRQQ